MYSVSVVSVTATADEFWSGPTRRGLRRYGTVYREPKTLIPNSSLVMCSVKYLNKVLSVILYYVNITNCKNPSYQDFGQGIFYLTSKITVSLWYSSILMISFYLNSRLLPEKICILLCYLMITLSYHFLIST